MIIPIDAEKAFDKIQYPFMKKKKTLQKALIEGTYLNIIKECSNYHTIALISHSSKVMLKILHIASAICEP